MQWVPGGSAKMGRNSHVAEGSPCIREALPDSSWWRVEGGTEDRELLDPGARADLSR